MLSDPKITVAGSIKEMAASIIPDLFPNLFG